MNIYVIGAGAAGMICAITAAELGANVYLIEKNEKTGKKIYVTGKGRCNLTNCTDFNGYMDNIINNKKFCSLGVGPGKTTALSSRIFSFINASFEVGLPHSLAGLFIHSLSW